jgi:hypothetical protein
MQGRNYKKCKKEIKRNAGKELKEMQERNNKNCGKGIKRNAGKEL